MQQFLLKFKSAFLNTFDLREGEYLRAILMQVYIFLIISVLLILKPVVTALFLAKFGVQALPIAYILVAITAGFVSATYARILDKFPLNNLISGTLVFSILCLVGFGVFFQIDIFPRILLYVFYVWITIFALLTTSQFWLLANIVFNAREAKRVFGFVGAGAIMGGIFGGYLASYLVPLVGSKNLAFVCAGLLMLILPITPLIWRRRKKAKNNRFQEKKITTESSDNPIALILRSKHLLYVSAILGVSVIVAKLVDYQFSDIAFRAIPDPEQLTIFFGFWFSTFNVISLIIQLFLTRRIIGNFSVGKSLMLLPIFILLSIILLIIAPELLAAAILLKMSEGSLKQSVNKAAMELVILPLPRILKSKTKTFIDVFVDSLATGLSGIILIFIVKGLDFSTQAISFMIVVFLLIWIYLVKQVRAEYLNSFQQKLKVRKDKNKNPVPQKTNFKQFDISLLQSFKEILEGDDEEQIHFALGRIREIESTKYFEPTKKLLSHPVASIRAEALDNLYYYPKNNISEQVEILVHDDSMAVKIAAFEYLIHRSPKDIQTLINRYWRLEDDKIRGAIIISLAKETRDNPKRKKRLKVAERIRKELEEINQTEDKVLQKKLTLWVISAIGNADIPDLFPVLSDFFKHPDKEIVKAAIEAAGNSLETDFIEPLLNLLTKKVYQDDARNAIVHFGKSIVRFLKKKIDKDQFDTETLRVLPLVLQEIDTQKSVNLLFELFENDDHFIRLEALRALNFLRKNHPELIFKKRNLLKNIKREIKLFKETTSILFVQNKIYEETSVVNERNKLEREKVVRAILIDLLEKRLIRNLERIFRLLALKYRSDYILTIHQRLKSKDPHFRVSALEFLDNILDSKLKFIIPIIEVVMVDETTEARMKNLDLKIPTELECFQMILRERNQRIKMSVFYLMRLMNDEKYIPLAKKYTKHKNPKIRDFAQLTLNSLRFPSV